MSDAIEQHDTNLHHWEGNLGFMNWYHPVATLQLKLH